MQYTVQINEAECLVLYTLLQSNNNFTEIHCIKMIHIWTQIR